MKRTYRHCGELREMHANQSVAIAASLNEYKSVPREKYFYELCFCLMTPQSSAAHAMAVQEQLERMCFHHTDFDPEPLLRQPDQYIRFHKTKAKRLICVKRQFEDVMTQITAATTAFDKREWLADNVNGLSCKEATHFLRNIGMNDGLAILDVHILRCLVKHGVISEIPQTLTKKLYYYIEKLFQEFADHLGIPIDELDLVFWSGATGFILK
jgi:N-glycosylase/DNA lyase